MPVCSYYCAHCGVKLAPEEARYGRPALRSLDWYCGACAVELAIEPAPSAPELPAAGRASSGSSGRSAAVRSGRFTPATGPAPGAHRPEPRGPVAPRSRTSPVIACVAAGVLGVGSLIAWRGALARRSPERPAPAAAPVASRPEPPSAAALPPAGSIAAVMPASARPSRVEASGAPPPAVSSVPAESFVANRSGRKFHLVTCRFAAAIKEQNRVPLATREAAAREGFEPCKKCLPSR